MRERQYMKKDLIAQVQIAGQAEARLSLLFRQSLSVKAKLHPTDMECLEVIINGKEVTPGYLSRETGLTTGAMTAALDRLERNKLIERARSAEDRRNVIVRPLTRNLGAIYALYQPFVAKATEVLESYSDEELLIIERHYTAMAAIYEAQIQANRK